MKPIKDKCIAILIEELFDDEEVIEPSDRLRKAGATVVFVGPTAPSDYTGLNGRVVSTDQSAGKIKLSEIDALVIPGGFAPGKMRMRHAMVDLVRDAVEAEKPVAAICHGPQMLISANAVRAFIWIDKSSKTTTSSHLEKSMMWKLSVTQLFEL